MPPLAVGKQGSKGLHCCLSHESLINLSVVSGGQCSRDSCLVCLSLQRTEQLRDSTCICLQPGVQADTAGKFRAHAPGSGVFGPSWCCASVASCTSDLVFWTYLFPTPYTQISLTVSFHLHVHPSSAQAHCNRSTTAVKSVVRLLPLAKAAAVVQVDPPAGRDCERVDGLCSAV